MDGNTWFDVREAPFMFVVLWCLTVNQGESNQYAAQNPDTWQQHKTFGTAQDPIVIDNVTQPVLMGPPMPPTAQEKLKKKITEIIYPRPRGYSFPHIKNINRELLNREKKISELKIQQRKLDEERLALQQKILAVQDALNHCNLEIRFYETEFLELKAATGR
jgi:hypothetical protein